MMGGINFAFEDLKVDQKAFDFVDTAYDLSAEFQKQELHGPVTQFNRAAVSIALNIAEDTGDTVQSFFTNRNRFCQRMYYFFDCGEKEKVYNFRQRNRKKPEELSKMISGVQKYLKNKSTK